MRCPFPTCPFVGTPAEVAEYEDYMVGFGDFEHDSRLRGMPYTDPGMDAEQTVRSLLAKRTRDAKLAREAREHEKRGEAKTGACDIPSIRPGRRILVPVARPEERVRQGLI